MTTFRALNLIPKKPVWGMFHIIVFILCVVHCDSLCVQVYIEISEAYIGFSRQNSIWANKEFNAILRKRFLN